MTIDLFSSPPRSSAGSALWARAALAAVIAMAAYGCGADVGPDGTDVGGACRGNADCDSDVVCHLDNEFPGGLCAPGCRDHEGCPDGARCVDEKGGICMQECYEQAECRSGWNCKGKRNRQDTGDSLVCVGD
jgi:hypothetical protein